MRISEVLTSAGGGARREVITIAPDASVRAVVESLAEHNIGALVVRDPDGGPVAGIVSERDVVRRIHTDSGLLDRPVSAIMTTAVKTCRSDARIAELMQMMTDLRIRHVPVVDAVDGVDQLVGIISIGDVVKNRIGELEFERDQLDSYVRQA